MKRNEYSSAEITEIGDAQELIQGWKDSPDLDASGNPPIDRLYQEWPLETE